jgi:hypothetical protein
MPIPEIASGTVEQALHTWSKRPLSGGRGQGFTAVSEGLRHEIGWLAALDLSGITEFEPGVGESEGFPDWQEMLSIGTLSAGTLRIVYRKIASAGSDAVERNRSAIHMLFGRSVDLDFASVGDDDPHWLAADDCPLDRPPRLEPIAAGDLRARQAQHDCEILDPYGRELLEQLVRPPYVLRAEFAANTAEPANFVICLLAAVPTQLWDSIGLDWRIGRRGPIVQVAMTDSEPSPLSLDRAEKAGLSACELHRNVDLVLSRLPISQRGWNTFSVIVREAPRGSRVVDDLDPSRGKARDQKIVGPVRAQLNATIGAAIGDPAWDGRRQLTGTEAARALKGAGELVGPGWLQELSPRECEALLGEIEADALGRVSRSFGAADVSTEELKSAWHQTGLAVIAAALLQRVHHKELEKWHAVPKRTNQPELEKLVKHLARSEVGLDHLVILLRHGFLEEGRSSMIAALVAVDPNPRFLFETVLEREEIEPGLLVPVLRQELDRFARWKGLGPVLEEALKLGLREHKGAFERLLSQLRRGDGTVEHEVEPSDYRPSL